jgi:hypothetical protein
VTVRDLEGIEETIVMAWRGVATGVALRRSHR